MRGLRIVVTYIAVAHVGSPIIVMKCIVITIIVMMYAH